MQIKTLTTCDVDLNRNKSRQICSEKRPILTKKIWIKTLSSLFGYPNYIFNKILISWYLNLSHPNFPSLWWRGRGIIICHRLDLDLWRRKIKTMPETTRGHEVVISLSQAEHIKTDNCDHLYSLSFRRVSGGFCTRRVLILLTSLRHWNLLTGNIVVFQYFPICRTKQ